jgi:phosphonate transport system ATP-binding protein
MGLFSINANECGASAGADIDCSAPHLSVRDLSFRREDRWLFQGMSWSIPRGKFVALVGPSGAGKSSLLYCLAGLTNPDQGQITWRCNGGCAHAPGGFKMRIGFVYQDLRLVPNSTLLANVLCGRLGHQPWWKTMFGFESSDRRKARELMGALGIEQYTYRCAGEVSGGEQQRAAIARALLQDPEVFLADEPVAHLDEPNAFRVLDVLKQQTQTGKKTVFCALHDSALVRKYADYVLRLDHKESSAWRLEEAVR